MEFYPEPSQFYNSDDLLFQVKSITYNIMFSFLPYDLKITENLTPEWGQENVIGRMDPIATFKRMTRSMTATFKVRSRYGDRADSIFSRKFEGRETIKVLNTDLPRPVLPVDDLLHAIDHVKKCLYPRYNSNQILTSPPLFRISYANLIVAGEDTDNSGVLCFITSFSANPDMGTNKITYKPGGPKQSSAKGELGLAAYPNIFDISVGFTILNEDLVNQQINGILNKRYFYNYSTGTGPHGGHEAPPETSATPETPAEEGKSEEEKAAEEAVTAGPK